MGYASRNRAAFWRAMWASRWRDRLPLAWTLVRHPKQLRVNARRFRGHLVAWLLGVRAGCEGHDRA